MRHIQLDNQEGTAPHAAFWMYFTAHWTYLSVSLPKCAIAMLIIQLFYPRKWVKFAFIGYCAGLCLLAIVGFVLSMTSCTPMAYMWNPYKHPNGHCWSQVALNVMAGTFSSEFCDMPSKKFTDMMKSPLHLWILCLPSIQALSFGIFRCQPSND